MKNNFNTTVNILLFAQWVTMICGLVSGVYWWINDGWIILTISILFVYASMNFHGLRVHLDKLIMNDMKDSASKSLKLWTGLNRRSRRKLAPKIKSELKKIEKK
jgi:hypothetical protein